MKVGRLQTDMYSFTEVTVWLYTCSVYTQGPDCLHMCPDCTTDLSLFEVKRELLGHGQNIVPFTGDFSEGQKKEKVLPRSCYRFSPCNIGKNQYIGRM